MLKPKALQKGNKIGLIAPAGFISKEKLLTALNSIKKLEFEPCFSDLILNRNGYLAGNDQERILDLENMFKNSEIKAIICVRGGFGCTRIIEKIDYEIIKQNPKILLGYSDNTALLQAVNKKTGLVCFHGPVGVSEFTQYTENSLKNVLMNPIKKQIENDKEENELQNTPYIICGGKSQGKLAGGNLSLLVSLIGTEFDISWDKKIIFIEEVGEFPYKIDRMLTQLIQNGKFKNVNGIIFGKFKNCDIDFVETTNENSFSLKEILEQKFSDFKIPIIYGFSIGHISNQATIPIGISAELDADNFRITLLENPVE